MSLASVSIGAIAAGGVVFLIGDTTAQSDELLRSLSSPNARSITLRATSADHPSDLLPASAVSDIVALPGVESAVVLSKVQSATTIFRDPTVSVGFFEYSTAKGPDPFSVVGGRDAVRGEAITSPVAAHRLRLVEPSAGVALAQDRTVAIVGSFEARQFGAIYDLIHESVITPAPASSTGAFILVLLVKAPADVRAVVTASTQLLTAFGTDRVTIEYDQRAAEVERLVARSGRSGTHTIAVAILLLAALVEAAIAFINAILQRRDIARRRALGYSRSMEFGSLIVEGAALTGSGAAVGAFAAVAALHVQRGIDVGGLATATAILVTLIGVVATMPGGLLAAVQDPARILRVP